MQILGQAPTPEQVALLTRVLASSAQPPGTLRYPELRGFLFAIASAPVLVKPSEWMPEVFGGSGPALETLKDAEAVLGAVMACYNEAARTTQLDGPIDPCDVGVDIDSDASLEEWSGGFAIGHAIVREAWGAVLEAADADDDRERLQLAIVALLVWADTARYREINGLDAAEMEELLATCRELFPHALGLLASTGREIYRATLAPRATASDLPRRSKDVGRNDPCPCGSGRKYKACCLRVH